jgi:hypothetical protein
MVRRAGWASALVLAVASLVALAAGASPGANQLAPRTASRAAWEPALLSPVPGSTRAYLLEARHSPCSGPPRLRLVPVTVTGGVGVARTVPPHHALRCQPTGTIGSMAFATADRGIVLEYSPAGLPSLYVTSDGARSWQRWGLVGDTGSRSARDFRVTRGGVSYLSQSCTTDSWCRGFTLESSSWSSASWRATRLPVGETQGGVAHARFGAALWVYDLHFGGVTLYHSPTGRPPFAHWPADRLGSVEACDLTPTSPTHVWAECPTGMQVSFLSSSSGGRTWRAVTRYQFFGTGGGAFDPVSSALAFLDYGSEQVTSGADLFRIDGDARATPVGRFECSDAATMDFANARIGIALCLSPTPGSTQPALERTADGGRTWAAVRLGR